MTRAAEQRADADHPAPSPRLDPHQRGVVLARAPQPEADRIARTGAAAIDGVGQSETGGPRRKKAGDVLVRDDQQSGIDGAHDASPFPELLADVAARVAGLALSGELLDSRLSRLNLVLERRHPAAPRAVADRETDRERQ